MSGQDDRWAKRRGRSRTHFSKHPYARRTRRELAGPRVRPAEDARDRGGGRKQNAATASETVAILEAGVYTYLRRKNEDGEDSEDSEEITVSIADDLRAAITGTQMYTSAESAELIPKIGEVEKPILPPTDGSTNDDGKTEQSESDGEADEKITEMEIEVTLETTLSACSALVKEYPQIAALNFASARNPGGGFLKGSSAQEESLCRSSGLYSCIVNSPMYAHNEAHLNKCLYTHYGIFSPNVPVIRDDDGKLIEPYKISFITCPAVNGGEASKRGVSWSTINAAMMARIDRILAIAKHNNTDALVLGAYGCGVFGNDIRDVVKMFKTLLDTKYEGAFKKVRFAVLGSNDFEVLCKTFGLEPSDD